MATQAEAVQETRSGESRTQKAQQLVRNHMLVAMGVGLIPIAVVDVAAVTGVQFKLIKSLAELYEPAVHFSDQKVYAAVGALTSGVGVSWAVRPTLLSALKLIPYVGTYAGMATLPLVAGASTYALGKVFITHFEAGGTLLSFEPEKMKAYYKKFYTEGQEVAAAAKPSAAPTA